jgi:hypothetical protein
MCSPLRLGVLALAWSRSFRRHKRADSSTVLKRRGVVRYVISVHRYHRWWDNPVRVLLSWGAGSLCQSSRLHDGWRAEPNNSPYHPRQPRSVAASAGEVVPPTFEEDAGCDGPVHGVTM